MTESWDEAFGDLRAHFVRDAGPRLDDVRRVLDMLAQSPGDPGLLDELLRRFHGFAGSGSTYGFPEVTAVALGAEKRCSELQRRGAPAGAADLDSWHEQLQSLREAILHPMDSPSPLIGERPNARAGAEAYDILIVDDDPHVRSLLARLVEQEGLAARLASTRAEAVASIDAHMPSGLIVDVRLPDGTGYQIAELVRARPGGDIPALLIVSVFSSFPDKVEAIHSGADGFFEKPVDWEALVRRLLHLLERNRPEPGRVLYVEDDPHQASFAQAVLATAAYEVRVCDDPRRFESDLVSFRPDLVLMDVVLPGISGYDLVRFLRQHERHATLPVLFLTTEGQVDARIEAARAGGDDHLLKPVSPPLLLAAVSARIERARFLQSLLGRDGLTRLLSHTAFLERATVAVAASRRHPDKAVAWVMLDLDHFKSVNDRFGHATGDRVITSLAALLRRRLRQSDTIGRYGGEEFAVLLDDLSGDDAARLVRRLLAEFAEQTHPAPDGSGFQATFSAGIAMFDPARMDLNRWRDAADVALYEAKRAGRNQVCCAWSEAQA